MRPLLKFVRLSTRDKMFLIYCAGVVAAFRLALYVATYRRISAWAMRSGGATASDDVLRRVVMNVRWMAKIVPRASCLTQALSVQYILSHRGYNTRIRIGVAREQGGGLAAHAWVLSGDRVIIGGEQNLGRYTVLTDLGPRAC